MALLTLFCIGVYNWLGASLVAQQWRICLQCCRPGFHPWVRKIPWRRAWQSTLVLLPREPHGQRNLAVCSPQGRTELDTTAAAAAAKLINKQRCDVSGEQRGDSATHIHAPFSPKLPTHLNRHITLSRFPCAIYAVGPCWLSILNTAVCTYPSQTPNYPFPPSSPPPPWPWQPEVCCLSLWVSVLSSFVSFLFRLHI